MVAPGAGEADALVRRAPARGDRSSRARRLLLEWGTVAVVAVVGAFLIRSFVVETFSVPSSSMYPTLQIGDRIAVDRLPGLAHAIHRGDVIVFHRVPADHDAQSGADLVKRVIGLPGETIASRGDTIYVDHRPVAEPWLHLDAVSPQGACAQSAFDIPATYATHPIPPGHYFVMGDCRGISDDSRFWGTVPQPLVIGRVFSVIWRSNHPWIHWL
jgi:signal peptidase I